MKDTVTIPPGDPAAPTTVIELRHPFNIAGGKKGGERIDRLELRDLRAGDLWDCPAASLGARYTLAVGVRMAGWSGAAVDKIARELGGKDMRAVTAAVSAAIDLFDEGALTAPEQTAFDADEDHVVELRDGVQVGSERVSELTLQPLRGRDVWDVPATGITFGHLFSVGAAQCGQADAVIRLLTAWDAGQLVGAVNRFLAATPATGETD